MKKGGLPGSPPEKAAPSSAQSPGAHPSLRLASPGCGSSSTRLLPSASPTCCRCLLAEDRGNESRPEPRSVPIHPTPERGCTLVSCETLFRGSDRKGHLMCPLTLGSEMSHLCHVCHIINMECLADSITKSTILIASLRLAC